MKRQDRFVKDSQGSVTVITIIMMFVIVGLMAFVIDMSHVGVVKNEIQNAGDAAVLRGARAFLPDNVPVTGPYNTDPDPIRAIDEAYNTIANNRSDNVAFQAGDVSKADIKVGIWDFTARNWLYGGVWKWPPDQSDWGKNIGPAISLPTNRNANVSLGPVTMTLARIFGRPTVSVSARATAALMGVGGYTTGGCPDFPICLSENLAENGGTIVFTPDPSDSGGWTVLQPKGPGYPPSSSQFIINYFKNPREGCGDLPPRTDISLVNGNMCDITSFLIGGRGNTGEANLVPPLNLVEVEVPSLPGKPQNYYVPGHSIDPAKYPEDPVYIFPVCYKDKFNQWQNVGATCARVTRVSSTPSPCYITIEIVKPCDKILMNTYTGGPWYGVQSQQPKLVE